MKFKDLLLNESKLNESTNIDLTINHKETDDVLNGFATFADVFELEVNNGEGWELLAQMELQRVGDIKKDEVAITAKGILIPNVTAFYNSVKTKELVEKYLKEIKIIANTLEKSLKKLK